MNTSTVQKMKNGLITTTGNIIVAGDFHIPQHDMSMVEMILRTASDYNIKTIVLNGDFSNQDAFSRFDEKDKNANWEKETTDCRFIMSLFQRYFTHIVWLRGNHDVRVQKSVGHKLSFDNVARILVDNFDPRQIITTEWDHVVHNGTWLICHPHEYSRKACGKAMAFADKYEMNVIVGHSHMLNHREQRQGNKVRHMIDGGHCSDPQKVTYSLQTVSSFPSWTQGFVNLIGQEPIIVSPEEPRKIIREY